MSSKFAAMQSFSSQECMEAAGRRMLCRVKDYGFADGGGGYMGGGGAPAAYGAPPAGYVNSGNFKSAWD